MRASSRRGSKQSQEKYETRFLWVLFHFNFALNWCINSSTMRLMPKHWTSSAGRKCRCWACSNVTSSESSRFQPKRNEKLFKTFKREKNPLLRLRLSLHSTPPNIFTSNPHFTSKHVWYVKTEKQEHKIVWFLENKKETIRLVRESCVWLYCAFFLLLFLRESCRYAHAHEFIVNYSRKSNSRNLFV